MELLPAAAALAVILITAGFILRTTPDGRDGATERVDVEPATSWPASDPEQNDPWVAEGEPLVVEELPPRARGRKAPVLAYVDQPRRSPDPERLIQTEVLVTSGSVAQTWRAVRLLVSLLALGALLGFGAIGFVRAVVWLVT